MASGDTLFSCNALSAEFPTTNYPQLNVRNAHPVLQFDTTTQETCYFSFVMPRNYAGGNIIPYVTWDAATATSGTIGWGGTFERMTDGSLDLDTDGFATENIITAATVPGTSGVLTTTNVTFTAGSTNTDSVTAGDLVRFRLRRDVANDTATGDANFYALELKEA